MFGNDAQHHVWWRPYTAYQQKWLIPIKQGGVRIWGCFVATGLGHLVVIESIMNSVNQSILESNMKLGHEIEEIYNTMAEK